MDPVVALPTAGVAVTIGALVLRGHQHRIGWLLVAHGVCFGVLLAFAGESESGPGLVVDQLGSGAWVFLFLWLVLIGYVLPTGHTASRWWRRWMQLGLFGVAAFLVGAAGDTTGFRETHAGTDPPLPWLPPGVSGVLGAVGLALTTMLFVGSAFAVRARLSTATGATRLQLLWLVWGATTVPTALLIAWVAHFVLADNPVVVNFALMLAGLGLPVAIGIAILRYQLFDIRVVLSRTLTYGVLVVAVVALYALLLFGANRLLGDSTAGGLLAVGLVAVAVHPAYSLLRTRIERWVYGYRSDPAAALRRLGASVESADPLHLVETITSSVAATLNVDRAWVEGPDTQLRTDPRVVRTPLVHRGERIGHLALQVPAGRTLSAADTALLHDLANQAAVIVRAAQLASELHASRSRIVAAREEERKRLRRDLHDGLGPSLAAILLKLEAVRSRTDDDREALLTEVHQETRAAIREIRRVVDDLRPPALDEVGLVRAIQQRAAALSTDALVCQVRGPADLPPLPAAVEVAAYRIASEAMANAVRHAHASRCNVDIAVDGSLHLTVSDDGRGSARPAGDGVGWTSMTERAAELGGTCTRSSHADGGLVVRALLPLHEPTQVRGLG